MTKARDLASIPAGSGDFSVDGGLYLGGATAANYLDDYEEGTWTLGIRDGNGNIGSTSSAVTTYTRIGRIVFIRGIAINIDTTGLTSASTILITGLPFTPNNFYPLTCRSDSCTFTGYLTGQTVGDDTACQFTQNKSGTFDDTLKVSEVTSGISDIDICGCYLTDA